MGISTDGSGVHRADTVTRYLDTLEEEPITWPGYSPDISPIENIWGWLKNEVSKEMPRDMIRLKACVRRHWGRIDANFLRPYFDTMFNRMQMIIENEGAKIKY